jgi:hypothetical protein
MDKPFVCRYDAWAEVPEDKAELSPVPVDPRALVANEEPKGGLRAGGNGFLEA